QATILRPNDSSLWVGLGQTYAEQDLWAKASEAFALALNLDPSDESAERATDIWYYLALAQLGGADHAGYRTACADMLRDLGPGPNLEDTNLTAWTCAL